MRRLLPAVLAIWLPAAWLAAAALALHASARALEKGSPVAAAAALACAVLSAVPPLWWWSVLRGLHKPTAGVVGFLHPNAADGGGGERVLFCAIAAVQRASPRARVVIFCAAGTSAEALAASAASHFGTVLPRPVEVWPLRRCALVAPESYPRLTLLCQALGSLGLTHEALSSLVPAVLVDATGLAFGYPLAAAAGCRVAAYVHYPWISESMIGRVAARAPGYNNSAALAESRLATWLKLCYYRALAAAYFCAGRCAESVAANSTWTARHMRSAWGRDVPIVYPPCGTESLCDLPLTRAVLHTGVGAGAGPLVISVAQFRPEKDHGLQLAAWAAMREAAARGGGAGRESPRAASPRARLRRGTATGVASADDNDLVLSARLLLVGGVRGASDADRVASLRAQATRLGITDSVEFVLSPPRHVLTRLLGAAHVGLHTMREEHFGISVVEYMAAGVIAVAHDSGGPESDIVVPEGGKTTGYRATTAAEFAAAMRRALTLGSGRDSVVAAARRRAARLFGWEGFERAFLGVVGHLLPG